MKVSAQYAETHLSDLISAADNGEVVEIARPDKPTLKLVVSTPVSPPNRPAAVSSALAAAKFASLLSRSGARWIKSWSVR